MFIRFIAVAILAFFATGVANATPAEEKIDFRTITKYGLFTMAGLMSERQTIHFRRINGVDYFVGEESKFDYKTAESLETCVKERSARKDWDSRSGELFFNYRDRDGEVIPYVLISILELTKEERARTVVYTC